MGERLCALNRSWENSWKTRSRFELLDRRHSERMIALEIVAIEDRTDVSQAMARDRSDLSFVATRHS